jgi:D-alanyl-D-alanine dipeptidase
MRLAAVAAAVLLGLTGRAPAQEALPGGLVHLREVDPSILQDIRYAGPDNFVGRPLDGYRAAECILKRDVAEALKRVQADLVAAGLSLKVYDCYRPERAVRDMVRWARDGRAADAGKRFYPKLEKRTLLGGYISARSLHSTGTAVDLTLVETARAAPVAFDPAVRYGSCIEPAAQRAPDTSVDMGTGYDCFDVMSHTANGAISADAKRRRGVLVAAMRKHGFRNYAREWWHFSFVSRTPSPPHDVPVTRGF